MAQIPKGLGYIKTIPFFLKIGAFVILLIALGTLGTFLDKADDTRIFVNQNYDIYNHWEKKSALDFGMCVIVVSWLVVILLVVLFITGLHEKITVINWPLTVAINMVIWAVLLFISGCLIADAVRHYDNDEEGTGRTLCDWLDLAKNDARCGHLIGATIVCFLAAVVFVIDAVFNFQLFRGKETPSAPAAVPT